MTTTTRPFLVLSLACAILVGCSEEAAPDASSTQTGAASAGVVLSPAKLSPAVFGFNPACIFPGTNIDPGWFSAASVGGKITVTGALLPGNNGTFSITHYVTPPGDSTDSANPGNVFTSAACTSETFPASAVVTYFAP